MNDVVDFADLRVTPGESALSVLSHQHVATHAWGSGAPACADRIKMSALVDYEQFGHGIAGEALCATCGDRGDVGARESGDPPGRV